MMDTSYWKTDDPNWMAARQEKWPDIEEWLGIEFKDAELGPDVEIERNRKYYFNGDLPGSWNVEMMSILHPSEACQPLREFIEGSVLANSRRNYYAGYGFKAMNRFLPLIEKKSSLKKKRRILF